MSSRKPTTIENYINYLTPWIRWLVQEQNKKTKAINGNTLKRYLNIKYNDKSYESYMRIGRQIQDFMNRYLNNDIKLIKPVSHQRIFENVQMPTKSMPILHEYLTNKLKEL